MTEQEAKTKWCPVFVVANCISNVSAVTLKSIGAPAEKCAEAAGWVPITCISSQCMMWSDGYCGLTGKV